jgi:hypothetical protein
VKVVFVADMDKYLYTGIPADYNDVIFTTGYSIENDLYHNSAIDTLMTKDDKVVLMAIISNFAKWYARQVHQIESGLDAELSNSPYTVIFNTHPFGLQPQHAINESDVNIYRSIYDRIIANYSLQLRGHSLMTILVMTFENRPKGDSRYYEKNLTEIAITAANLPIHLNDLVNRIANKLAET